MSRGDSLARQIELCRKYDALFRGYTLRGPNWTRDPNDKENEGAEAWQIEQYKEIGLDALRIMVASLITAQRDPPKRILDFPSGSGRVTRHMRAYFPEAVIGACDLYKGHVDFCVQNFGATAIMSKENLDDLNVGADWDLIFCGSLLTHLPPELFWKAIDFMSRSLSPTGIAIITLEGRRSEYIQASKWHIVAPHLFESVTATLEPEGFGYVDYDHTNRMKDKFDKQSSYGATFARPWWTMKGLTRRLDVRVLSYTEGAWNDHQDVLVIGRPGIQE